MKTETIYTCMKHNIDMCDTCFRCRDPEIYCKFRSSCPIWFLDKRNGRCMDDAVEEKKIKKER